MCFFPYARIIVRRSNSSIVALSQRARLQNRVLTWGQHLILHGILEAPLYPRCSSVLC
jgi:hypothetical protein